MTKFVEIIVSLCKLDQESLASILEEVNILLDAEEIEINE